MRILILTNKMPYPPIDGGSIATLNMLTGLHKAGNQVTCMALNTNKHKFPVKEIPGELGEIIRFIGIDCDTSIRPLLLLGKFVIHFADASLDLHFDLGLALRRDGEPGQQFSQKGAGGFRAGVPGSSQLPHPRPNRTDVL